MVTRAAWPRMLRNGGALVVASGDEPTAAAHDAKAARGERGHETLPKGFETRLFRI